jgi:hypothetical protein
MVRSTIGGSAMRAEGSRSIRAARAVPAGAALGLAVLGVLVACSADPDAKSAGGQGRERETELKHEPCDVDASSAKKIDVNGDGKPDITHVMSGAREACRVVDLNLDGAVDAFIYYDDKGQERRRESDFDRDGRADEIAFLNAGVVARKERETNFDNKIDTWDFYEGGRLTKRERDSDGDAIIDQWWQFNNPQNPKCAVVASDRNADGKPDPDSVVDLCADSYGAPKAPPPPAAPPTSSDAGALAPAASPDAGAAPPAADAGAPSSATDAGAAKPVAPAPADGGAPKK